MARLSSGHQGGAHCSGDFSMDKVASSVPQHATARGQAGGHGSKHQAVRRERFKDGRTDPARLRRQILWSTCRGQRRLAGCGRVLHFIASLRALFEGVPKCNRGPHSATRRRHATLWRGSVSGKVGTLDAMGAAGSSAVAEARPTVRVSLRTADASRHGSPQQSGADKTCLGPPNSRIDSGYANGCVPGSITAIARAERPQRVGHLGGLLPRWEAGRLGE
mmetsp:Transcript_23493/g.56911  ORF Transcript_23493/g.56911 Transcript_23493/m.56911 type:complete len:220 (+) Transcript_23493:726-1385(+)